MSAEIKKILDRSVRIVRYLRSGIICCVGLWPILLALFYGFYFEGRAIAGSVFDLDSSFSFGCVKSGCIEIFAAFNLPLFFFQTSEEQFSTSLLFNILQLFSACIFSTQESRSDEYAGAPEKAAMWKFQSQARGRGGVAEPDRTDHSHCCLPLYLIRRQRLECIWQWMAQAITTRIGAPAV